MIAPSASTCSTRSTLGMLPSLSMLPASVARPTMVPMASKKMLSRITNASRVAATKPRCSKAPNGLAWPISDRSGAAHSENAGATRDQPCGL